METQENENAFTLNDQSRQRNRKALRTIKGLILLFTVTVIPVRVFSVLIWVFVPYATEARPLFFRAADIFDVLTMPILTLFFYLNNVLNIFVYAKMIPDFRRFLLTVFTFGIYGRRNAIN